MIDPRQPEQVGPALVAWLRARLSRPELELVQEPIPLFGGNHTFVHAFQLGLGLDLGLSLGRGSDAIDPIWKEPLVLRILRSHRVASEVVFESVLQNALAPLAPRVLAHEVDSAPLGGAFQIMERLPGRALLLGDIGQDTRKLGILRPLLGGLGEALGRWPERLAETHARVHALSPEPVLRALDACGMREGLGLERRLAWLQAQVEELSLASMAPVVDWLRARGAELSARDDARLCHGDLFPNQVFAQARSVTGVIDWSDATLAPGGLDVGLVCAGMETIPLPIPGLPLLQRRLVRRFRDAYARLRPIDPQALRFGEVLRSATTLVALARHRAGKGDRPVPYDAPGGEQRLLTQLARNGFTAKADGTSG